MRLLMSGDPDFRYAIDFSTDFSNWTSLAAFIATNATFEYIDHQGAHGLRYYRLRAE